ncbi:ATP-NAD kinase-like domain-containing protein [Hyaloraphidium curvatum]|nr:ATP-NAD kinase-like domain-containing protein [Hyaloraphidium curvatum]
MDAASGGGAGPVGRSLHDPLALLAGAVAFVFLAVVLRTLFFSRPRAESLKSRSPHRWTQGAAVLPAYCDACEGLIAFQAETCMVCGRCAHPEHVRRADALPCKAVSDLGGVFVDGAKYSPPHQLVRGNLPLGASCAVCGESAGTEPGLWDQRCLWCGVAVHTDCRHHLSPVCTLGPVPELVLDPRAVTVSSRGRIPSLGSSRYRLALDLPRFAAAKPVLCFINPKSGEQASSQILSALFRALNPLQILDLSEHGPETLLKVFAPYLSRCRILVCGGDGTIAWVLNALDSIGHKGEAPPVGLIPLGTGNDLARVLGWGGGYRGENIFGILRDIRDAEPVVMDRWKVTSVQPGSRFTRKTKTTQYMINYFSVGVDAAITLGFHTTRESNPELFRNRQINKFIYFLMGTRFTANWLVTLLSSAFRRPPTPPKPPPSPPPRAQRPAQDPDVSMMTSSDVDEIHESTERPKSSSPPPPPILNLGDMCRLWLDGTEVSTNGLASVVCLNIPSFGGGSKMALPAVDTNDERLEVISLSNSVHLASALVGLTNPIVLGRAREVKIQLKQDAPVQLDGEPYVNPPATITLSVHKKAVMLRRIPTDIGEDDASTEEESSILDGYSSSDSASTAEFRSLAALSSLRKRTG